MVLNVLEALAKEIPEGIPESVSICMKNIEKSVDKIEVGRGTSLDNILQQLLTEINNAKAEHNAKWFSSWRSLDLTPKLDELRKQKGILDKRVDLLMKVLTIHK